METAKITIEMPLGLAAVFREMEPDVQARYQRLFTMLVVEGGGIAGFFEEVMAEIITYAERDALNPAALMHILDEAYEDLDAHAAADAATRDDTVPWGEVKRELGL